MYAFVHQWFVLQTTLEVSRPKCFFFLNQTISFLHTLILIVAEDWCWVLNGLLNIAVSLFWPILQFFRPVIPVNIRVVYDDNGRPSGEADVEFNNHDDALRAMSKDKSHMQHRYIELFLNSTPGNSGGGYGNGGGFNSGKH